MANRSYCFTLHTEEEPTFDGDIHRYLVYQRERCPTTGKLHWQGYCELFNPRKIPGFQKSIHPSEKFHVEKRRGTPQEARAYCMKEESRVEGTEPIEHGVFGTKQGSRSDLTDAVAALKTGGMKRVAEEHPEAYVRFHKGFQALQKELREVYVEPKPAKWRKWQKHILDIIDGPVHDKQITWVCDYKGDAGKTLLTRYLMSNAGALYLAGATLKDAAFAFNGQKIIIFDVPRDAMEHLNYGLIEKIKDGVVFSGKYEPEQKIYAKPHVFVFANQKADWSRFTVSRKNEIIIDDSWLQEIDE